MQYTNHAMERVQQRGFREAHVNLILEYGREKHKHGGCIENQLYKRDVNDIIESLKKKINNLQQCKNKALLVDNKSCHIITAYNRRK